MIGEVPRDPAPSAPPPVAAPAAVRPPPNLIGRRRCGHCGVLLPPGGRPGYPCPYCRRPVVFAPLPVPRGPAGWCHSHPTRPLTGICASCGVFTCVECEVSIRGVRYCDDCRELHARHLAAPVPWEERREIGRFRAWWRTTVEITARPHLMFEHMRPRGDLGSAVSYGLVGCVMQSSTQQLFLAMYMLMIFAVGIAMAFSGASGNDALVMLAVGGVILAVMIGTPLLVFISFMVLASLQHVALRLVGAGQNGLEATLKVACYALGTGWGGIVPYFGATVQPIWWTVLMVIGVAKAHRCSPTKALVTLIPVLLACVAPVVAWMAVIVIAAIAEAL